MKWKETQFKKLNSGKGLRISATVAAMLAFAAVLALAAIPVQQAQQVRCPISGW